MDEEHEELDDMTTENVVQTLVNVAMLGTSYCPRCSADMMDLARERLNQMIDEELRGDLLQ
jgi:hypothetical protein